MAGGKDGNSRRKGVIGIRETRLLPPRAAGGSVMAAAAAICALHGNLLDLRARRYVAGLGAFASLDPFEGMMDDPMSINGYSYVHGNPLNWTDPTGKICFIPIIGQIACALAFEIVATAAAAILALIWANAAREIAEVCNNNLCFSQPPPPQGPEVYPATPPPMGTLPPSNLIPITPVPIATSPGTPYPVETLPASPLNAPPMPPLEGIPVATPPAPGSNYLLVNGTDPNLAAYKNGYGQAIDQVPSLDGMSFSDAIKYLNGLPNVRVSVTPGNYHRYIFPDNSEITLEPPPSNEVTRLPVRAYGPNGSPNASDSGSLGRVNNGVRYDIFTGKLYYSNDYHNLPQIEKTK